MPVWLARLQLMHVVLRVVPAEINLYSPMSNLQLNAVATRLLLDDDFKHALLEERRGECLSAFQLTDWERSVILSIRTNSPRHFIGELHNIVQRHDLVPGTAARPKVVSG